MRVCVFVDGENLRHTIVELFKPTFHAGDYLPKQADWSKVYDEIVYLATSGYGTRQRTYWYVSQDIQAFPRAQSSGKRKQEDLDRWATRNKHLLRGDFSVPAINGRYEKLNEIQDILTDRYNSIRSRFDGFTVIQNGISLKHRSIEFRRSGAIPYNLTTSKFGQEKTVDVNLAVDMVTLHANYDLAVIVSGDQDYVPAAQAIKNLGKHVVNVSFKARSGALLPGGAVRLNHCTDWSVDMDYDAFRQLLGIAEATTAPPVPLPEQNADEPI